MVIRHKERTGGTVIFWTEEDIKRIYRLSDYEYTRLSWDPKFPFVRKIFKKEIEGARYPLPVPAFRADEVRAWMNGEESAEYITKILGRGIPAERRQK